MKKIVEMENSDENFYKFLGPVFGSREVQRVTGDRFYDDPGKKWYFEIGSLGEVVAVVSVKDNVIKNVYASDNKALLKIMKGIHADIKESKVPVIYKEVYENAGYIIEKDEYLKRFIKIRGGFYNGTDIK